MNIDQMTIVTWNCNGAFRKKYAELAFLNADIMVIQECENPETSIDKAYKEWAVNYLWTGDNKNKGLGIFCKKEISLVRNNWEDNKTKYFISARINDRFNLLAVWNHHAQSPNFKYIGQLWKYLQVNKIHLKEAIIAGDFNSNTIWDEWDRWWNHTDVVRELDDIGIRSLYHEYFNERQGKESNPTFFLQRNQSKAYHIDYVFASTKMFTEVRSIVIGNSSKWLKFSDHLPMIISL